MSHNAVHVGELAEKAMRRPRRIVTSVEMADWYKQFVDYQKRGWGVMDAVEAIAEEEGRNWETVYHNIRRMTPTTDAAGAFLRGSALALTRRLVAKANPSEIIDVLSRSNMGVIAPKKEGGEGGGFFLSVQADSCGAVKIGVSQGGELPLPEPRALPPLIDVPPIHSNQETTDGQTTLQPRQVAALAAYRKRRTIEKRERGRNNRKIGLAKRAQSQSHPESTPQPTGGDEPRQRGHQKDGGVQVAHGLAEGKKRKNGRKVE